MCQALKCKSFFHHRAYRLCCFITMFYLLDKISRECMLAFQLPLVNRKPFEDLVCYFLAQSSQGFLYFHWFCNPLNSCVNKSRIAFWIVGNPREHSPSEAASIPDALPVDCGYWAWGSQDQPDLGMLLPTGHTVMRSWAITTGCCFKPSVWERFILHQ